MATKVQDILKKARALSPQEQLQILQELTQSLAHMLSPVRNTPEEFWIGASLEELAR